MIARSEVPALCDCRQWWAIWRAWTYAQYEETSCDHRMGIKQKQQEHGRYGNADVICQAGAN
jgi:hypothetical protein